MIVFCVQPSAEVANLVCRCVRALRERRRAVAVVGWSPLVVEEYGDRGEQVVSAWTWSALPFPEEYEMREAVHAYVERGQPLQFHNCDLHALAQTVWPLPFDSLGRTERIERLCRLARCLGHMDGVLGMLAPRAVILWNSLSAEAIATTALARRYTSTLRFIERGPFPRTAQVDAEGVNGAASIVRDPLDAPRPEDMAWTEQLLHEYQASHQSAWQQPEPEEDGSLLARVGVPLDRPFALFAGQVPGDTNITHLSPFGEKYADVYRWLAGAYADRHDVTLVVKRHPKSQEDAGDAKSILGPRAIWTDQGNIQQWLRLCHHVVSVNSTVGFEAAVCGKPVVILGQAFYGGPSGRLAFAATTPGDLRQAVQRILTEPHDGAAQAARALDLLARLRRKRWIWSCSEEDARRLAEHLCELIPFEAGGGSEEFQSRAFREINSAWSSNDQYAQQAILWHRAYERLASTFPIPLLLRMRRRLLGLAAPPTVAGRIG